MSGFKFGARSLKNLEGVHPDLVKVAHRALEITTVDFMVTEGRRTIERQRQLLKAGATRTLKSRHLTGHAIDIAPVVDGEVRWDWPLFDVLAAAMTQAAKEHNVSIVWGGSWRNFRDGPHFELNRRVYPA